MLGIKIYRLRDRYPDLFPITWRRHADNPMYRYRSYNVLRLADPDPCWLRDMLWLIRPSLSRIPIATKYWRAKIPAIDAETDWFWIEQTGIKGEDELNRHLHAIRDAAWQVVQEFSIARWWFLRSIITNTSFYSEVIDLARNGATIVYLGCGFGQELRRLWADGATGELYGVDVREAIWDLGLQLFNQTDEEEWTTGKFRKATILSTYSQENSDNYKNTLVEFAGKAEVFLLNDVMSFWGSDNMCSVIDSIERVSKVGTRIIGWLVGQEDDENT